MEFTRLSGRDQVATSEPAMVVSQNRTQLLKKVLANASCSLSWAAEGNMQGLRWDKNPCRKKDRTSSVSTDTSNHCISTGDGIRIRTPEPKPKP